MIPIIYNGKPYLEGIKAFRVSKDGALAGLVMKNNEIMIYRVSKNIHLYIQLLDNKGDYINEKTAQKPIKILKVKES